MAHLTPLMRPKAAFILHEGSQSTLSMLWLSIPGLCFGSERSLRVPRRRSYILHLADDSMSTHFLRLSCSGHCAAAHLC